MKKNNSVKKYRIELCGKEVEYTKATRDVKYPRLEFKDGMLSVIINCPGIDEKPLIDKHKRWILNYIDYFEDLKARSKKISLREELSPGALKEIAAEKAGVFAEELGVGISGPVLRLLKTKWGSCTSGGRVTLNTLLRFLPDRYIDYIIFHEVAHMVESRHNKRFYNIIKGSFPDKDEIEKELPAYWYLIKSLPG